jgi:hypothetical protein
MTKYLVLYRSSLSAGEQMAGGTPEQAEAGMKAWMDWAGRAGDALIDLGSPLTPVATVGPAGTEAPGAQTVGGFSIMQADSLKDVTALLDDHPHFLSPGESSIEVLEFLPIPGS